MTRAKELRGSVTRKKKKTWSQKCRGRRGVENVKILKKNQGLRGSLGTLYNHF